MGQEAGRRVLVCDGPACRRAGSRHIRRAVGGWLSRRGDWMIATDCLEWCHRAPLLVVYPEGAWYGGFDPAEARGLLDPGESIQAAHLLFTIDRGRPDAPG